MINTIVSQNNRNVGNARQGLTNEFDTSTTSWNAERDFLYKIRVIGRIFRSYFGFYGGHQRISPPAKQINEKNEIPKIK